MSKAKLCSSLKLKMQSKIKDSMLFVIGDQPEPKKSGIPKSNSNQDLKNQGFASMLAQSLGAKDSPTKARRGRGLTDLSDASQINLVNQKTTLMITRTISKNTDKARLFSEESSEDPVDNISLGDDSDESPRSSGFESRFSRQSGRRSSSIRRVASHCGMKR